MGATATENLRAAYTRHKGALWALLVILPFAVVAVGLLVRPDLFWDRFIWQDIYGPLWTDAHQCGNSATGPCRDLAPNPGGVTAKDGYTITSELVYGGILAVSLYAIFTGIFRRFGVVTDGWFVLALLPYILLGPTGRTLEDADVFIGDGGIPGVFAFIFISPIIYIHIAVYTVAFLLLGVAIERARSQLPWTHLVATVGAVAATMTAAYALIGASYSSGFSAFAPGWVFALGAALGVLFFAWRAKKGEASVNATLFALGLPLAFPPLYLIAKWLADASAGRTLWSERVFNGELHLAAGATILTLAAIVVLTVAVIALLGSRFTSGRVADGFRTYLIGINLALVLGHMIDGIATWIALMDPFHMGLPNYAEKHPFSDMLLEIGSGTAFAGLGFPVAKLLMILGVVWLLDREFEKEGDADRQLVGLIKMAIFVLGFAPGFRDLLRITMGV